MFQYHCLIIEHHYMTSCGELMSSNRISWSLNIAEVHNASTVLSLPHPSVESPYTKHSPSALRSTTSLSWLFQLCINNVGYRAAIDCLLEAEKQGTVLILVLLILLYINRLQNSLTNWSGRTFARLKNPDNFTELSCTLKCSNSLPLVPVPRHFWGPVLMWSFHCVV